METIKNDSRGQSSVADALFFFSIASILALFLFVFSTNYGTTLRNQTDKEQFREYASSALKTILYTSTPRDPCCTLEECSSVSPCTYSVGAKPEEIDFLLAAAKEDFADDGNFGDTAVTIKNTLRGIMQPLSASADYLFFFYMPTEPQYQFPYFLFYRSVNNVNATGGIKEPNRCSGEKGCHESWYCKPTDLGSVNQFLFSLSNFSRTSSKAHFLSASPIPGQPPRQVDSEIHFILWPSVTFDDSSPIGAFQALNCCPPEPKTIPENQTECYQKTFVSNPKVGGGVSFEIVPNTVRFPAGYTGTKEVVFKLRNKSDKPLEQANVVDMISAPNNCPVQLPSFSLPFPAAVTITNEQLQDPNPPHLTEQYSVQGSEGADLEFNGGTVDTVRSLYAQAPPTYAVLLYKLDPQSKPVNKPTPSFLPCQFELKYRLQGDSEDRILHAQLSISAEQ